MTRFLLGGFLLVSLTAFGCGPTGPPKYKVEGHVTFDGKPIPSGYIWFRDKSGQVGSVEARINDGAYTLESYAGERVVEISMLKEVPLPGNRPNEEGDTTTKIEALPERYNAKSELEVTVGPDLKTQDFDLTSKR